MLWDADVNAHLVYFCLSKYCSGLVGNNFSPRPHPRSFSRMLQFQELCCFSWTARNDPCTRSSIVWGTGSCAAGNGPSWMRPHRCAHHLHTSLLCISHFVKISAHLEMFMPIVSHRHLRRISDDFSTIATMRKVQRSRGSRVKLSLGAPQRRYALVQLASSSAETPLAMAQMWPCVSK